MAAYSPYRVVGSQAAEKDQLSQAVESYVNENQDKVFVISNGLLNYTDPWTVTHPWNCSVWGDWGYHLPLRTGFFAHWGYPNGFDDQCFLDERVRIITNNERKMQLVCSVTSQTLGTDVSCVAEDAVLGQVVSYRLILAPD